MSNARDKILVAEQFAREFLLDHPHASVDTIAREVEKRCTHALHKTAISRIKREVTEQITAAQNGTVQGYASKALPAVKNAHPPIVRKRGQPIELAHARNETPKAPPPFNPPRIHISQNDPERDTTVSDALQQASEAAPPQPTTPEAPPLAPSQAVAEWPPAHDPRWNKALKEKWLYGYLEKHPEATLQFVTAELKKLAGSSLWAPEVATALRIARGVAGIPVIPSRYSRLKPTRTAEEIPSGAEVLSIEKEKSTKEVEAKIKAMHQAAKELARHMKLCSMRSYVISIDTEGGVDFHAERVEVSELGGKLDLDT